MPEKLSLMKVTGAFFSLPGKLKQVHSVVVLQIGRDLL
jgi:hypothetical protein